MKELTSAEKSDLFRLLEGWTHGTSREVLFAREVQKQGMDYMLAADYGIEKLQLNRNSLNSAYNELQKTIGLYYI